MLSVIHLRPAITILDGVVLGEEAGNVYFEFASFCDQQLQNPGNLEDFNRITKLRQKKREEVKELEKLARSIKKTEHKDGTLRQLRQSRDWLSIDDAEYNGKLYGLGQTFALTNGTEPVRGSAATLAEREDRGPQRELTQTPGPTQSHSVPMALATPAMAGAMPAQIPPSTPYGPMGANGPYMRPTMGVVGGR